MILRGRSLCTGCASCSCSPKELLCSRNRCAQKQIRLSGLAGPNAASASLAQLVEHALRKRMVVGSIPTGGCLAQRHHELRIVKTPEGLSQAWSFA